MTAFPQPSLRDRVFYRVTRRRQARIEMACWRDAAHVIFCSAVDRDRAERLLPGVAARSAIVPNCVDVRGFTPRPGSAFVRGGPVVFVGTTRYPPNFFAVEEICRALAPALPHLDFHIVGEAPWRPAAVPANVQFLGRVASTAEPLSSAQVAIAPVRHGSGTRLKILEYFAAGLPVVCTTKAAEGLDLRDGVHARLAQTTEAFVAAIRELHAEPGRAAGLGAAARALVEERYDWQAYVPSLLAIYAAHGR
jgi:glycosyltransferase involved in cell wall biosynthesis